MRRAIIREPKRGYKKGVESLKLVDGSFQELGFMAHLVESVELLQSCWLSPVKVEAPETP